MNGITRYPRAFVPVNHPEDWNDDAWVHWKASIGDEPGWSWGAVQVFRSLASLTNDVPLPANPFESVPHETVSHDAQHYRETTYWTALHALTTFRLGWANPGNGVSMATLPDFAGDPMLEMIASVWRADGTLSEYVNWSGAKTLNKDEQNIASRSVIDGKHVEATHITNAWLVGWDKTESSIAITNKQKRTAALVCETANGWYGDLTRLGASLPDIGNNSWHVDVFVKSIGFMGTFRKSRVTNRWFVGRHAVHMLGNVEPLLNPTA